MSDIESFDVIIIIIIVKQNTTIIIIMIIFPLFVLKLHDNVINSYSANFQFTFQLDKSHFRGYMQMNNTIYTNPHSGISKHTLAICIIWIAFYNIHPKACRNWSVWSGHALPTFGASKSHNGKLRIYLQYLVIKS